MAVLTLTLTLNPTIDKSTRIDHVIAERKLRCETPRCEPGGGSVNVSRVIHELGGESQVTYLAGGPSGQMLQDLLDQSDLNHRPIQIAEWTRESLTVYEASTGQQYRFGMPGPMVREGEWRQCLEEISHVDPVPEFLVASGSLPPGVPRDFYARLARCARDLGAKMVLDTSGEALALAVQEGVFLTKPNMREIQILAGGGIEDESEQMKLAERIVQRGQVEVFVISLGRAGALVVWSDGHEHVRAPSVPIESKVGAGDSMVGGIVLGLTRGFSVLDAVRFGVAAGTAAVMTPGTELCRREDVERLYHQMRQD